MPGARAPACTTAGQEEGQSSFRNEVPRSTGPPVLALDFTGPQVTETRGTDLVLAAAGSGTRASPHQRGREQMCCYGAVTPRLHDARGCTTTAICACSQIFYIMDSSCCVVCSASNSHDGLKIDYCAVVNLNATLLVFILLIY